MAGDPEKTALNPEAEANELPEPPDFPPDMRTGRDGAEEDGSEDFLPGLDDNGPAGERDTEETGPEEVKSGGGSRARKILFYTLPALCLVAVAAVLLIKSEAVGKFLANQWHTKEKPVPVTSITRPVPVPEYREMLDFFVLDETEGQKTITAFRVEVAFSNLSRYQNFKEHNVTFRDTAYSFLLAQNSSRNTRHSWQAVVEKDLFEFIRAKLPESKPDTMRLTQVENL